MGLFTLPAGGLIMEWKKINRICEYCGATMKFTIDEDGELVFDCPNCMNTYIIEERKEYK